MVDKVITTMGNDQDDWEVAVDTGEFDKRLEQLEKDRAATQESILSSTTSTTDDSDNRNFSNTNLIKTNKPIRILKRPTSQSQLPVINNEIPNSNTILATNNNNNNNSSFSNNISSSTTVPVISIIPRNQTKDVINSSQSTKSAIKTYEQRELEYRLARLRIMGEEESSIKDNDDADNLTNESNKTTSSSQSSTQNNSISNNSNVANLCTLNNSETTHFVPNMNSTEYFSQQQQYHGAQSTSYPQMPLSSSIHYPPTTIYMPPSSNTMYHYQQQTSYGTQQYGQQQ
ncbi:unnamed protein product [Adineta steineri]|uniref:SUZ domain-containing protein n=1 Tax=Adineta steineri TaxID=433720 RepID=A0A814WYD6_9BILA|nr:unnamed protein product [Adineta steineri]